MKKIFLFCILSGSVITSNAQNDPSSTVGDTGTVTFTYQGATVTYTTVRAADGMIWLQQNMGSAQIADSLNDTLAYGHYFQWGRWDDGHQLANSPTALTSNISPNDPSGIPAGNPNFLSGTNPRWWNGGAGTDTWSADTPSTTNGTDPCAAISPGWHLPSQAEFANVITLEGITDTGTGFSSNLIVANAGFRSGSDGSFSNVGSRGRFWTSSTDFDLAVAVGIEQTLVSSWDETDRYNGINLRCMTSCTGVFAPDTINGADTVCENSINTYSVPAVNNADGYIWTIPTGWTIIGASNLSTISLLAAAQVVHYLQNQ